MISQYLQPSFVGKIFEHYEKSRTDWRRPHLGASLLGCQCSRSLWLSFRWAVAPEHNGRTLRLFDTGNREEGRIVRDLRNIGLEVLELDPATGRQFHVELSAHCGGSLDGIAQGFDEAPKKWHVVEFKTHGQKSFDELQAKGVEKAKPYHYAQMLTYMAEMNRLYPGEFDRAMYIAVNKNTDDIYAERIKLDHLEAQKIKGRALAAIAAENVPAGISDNKENPACLFCNFQAFCFGEKWRDTGKGWAFVPERAKLEVNCRTCLHSTPAGDGWTCASLGGDIGIDKQKNGCEKHLFVPGLLPGWFTLDACAEWVKYDKGINYAGGRVEQEKI